MKKVLVLSIFTLPSDVIASYRTMAYLKHFYKNGIYPTILTQFVTPEDRPHELYETGEIIRIHRKKTNLTSLYSKLEEIPIINKLSILYRWMSGFLDGFIHDIETYSGMKDYCHSELNMHEFDLIIGIFSPHHHLKLCYELSQKYRIPYALDFRDLWHNRVIHKNYHPSITEKIQDRITLYYWRKWLSNAIFFTITSHEWKQKIASFTTTPGYVVTNGFDKEEFNKQSGSNKLFTIVHTGSLYEHQDLMTFLEGAKRFLDNKKPEKFLIEFIGGDRSGGVEGQISGYLYKPVERIREYLPEKYCVITHRIPKNEVIHEIVNADLLLFPSFPDAPGTYASKIFDYLGAKRNILMVPDDNGVVSRLIEETKAGFIANSSDDVYEVIKEQYENWQRDQKIQYQGDEDLINLFSRENQVNVMSELIHKYLSDDSSRDLLT